MQILTDEAMALIAKEKPPWANYFVVEPSGNVVYFEQRPVFREDLELFLRPDRTTKARRLKLDFHSVHEI